MILAVDVHYENEVATVAGVAFANWEDAKCIAAGITCVHKVQEYVPGKFYQRELPCLLALLEEYRFDPACIVIDGYVTLDGKERPGLGLHLYEKLDQRIPVIGVAKTAFAGIGPECQLIRGSSKKPLYITSAGLPLSQAKANVLAMHGTHRLPTLLKEADRLCRTHKAMTKA